MKTKFHDNQKRSSSETTFCITETMDSKQIRVLLYQFLMGNGHFFKRFTRSLLYLKLYFADFKRCRTDPEC